MFFASHWSKVWSCGFSCRATSTLRAARHFLFEVAVDLEHVAHLVGAGETEAAVDVGVDGVVAGPDRCPGPSRASRPFRRSSGSRRDADRLADVLRAGLEDAVGDLADVFGRDAASLLSPIGNVQLYCAVGSFLRRETERCRGCPSRTTSPGMSSAARRSRRRLRPSRRSAARGTSPAASASACRLPSSACACLRASTR